MRTKKRKPNLLAMGWGKPRIVVLKLFHCDDRKALVFEYCKISLFLIDKPRLARKIANWINKWADWYEQDNKK
jgi:hypothetical protein